MDRTLVLAGLIAIAFGCGGTEARRVGIGGNTATLTGDPVGLGSDSAESLTRVIPVALSGLDVSGDSAVLGRQTATSSSYTFIAPITHAGGPRRCFIQADTFELLDRDGAVLGKGTTSYLAGSVGRLKDGGMYTATCLDAGETGYLLALFSRPDYAAIASARIALHASQSEWEAPETAVIPIAYSAPARNTSYTVTVANQGPVTAMVGLSKVIYIDHTGTPAYWNFLYPGSVTQSAPHALAPGASYGLNCDGGTALWTGSATMLLVFVDFGVP